MNFKKTLTALTAVVTGLLCSSALLSAEAYAEDVTRENISADILEDTTETDSEETTDIQTETQTVETEETTEPKTIQENVIDLINQYRTANGEGELSESASLDEIAKERSSEINSLLSHYRPNSKIFSTILNEYGISVKYIGETIAAGNDELDTPEEVAAKWFGNEEDRAMILESKYQYVGIHMVESGNSTYKYNWVMILAGDSSYLNGEKNSIGKGDLNGDGEINSTDAVMILKSFAATLAGSQSKYTSFFMEKGDINGDGSVNSVDAVKILIYYAKTLTGADAEL